LLERALQGIALTRSPSLPPFRVVGLDTHKPWTGASYNCKCVFNKLIYLLTYSLTYLHNRSTLCWDLCCRCCESTADCNKLLDPVVLLEILRLRGKP